MIAVVVAIVHAAGALAPVVGGCGRLGCSLSFGALSYTAPEARGGALAPSPLVPSLTRPGDRAPSWPEGVVAGPCPPCGGGVGHSCDFNKVAASVFIVALR